MIKKIFYFFFLSLLFLACTKNKRALLSTEQPLVEVNGEILYVEDLEKIISKKLSSEDSAIYAEAYIKKWIIDILSYEKASNNITDIDEIEQLVANYKKSLIIHRYQQNLLEQKIKEPTDEAIKEYYEENIEKFKLKENIIKGIYIKIPNDAPKIKDLYTWLHHQKTENLQNIEKYSYQNAVIYEYFGNNWLSLDEIVQKNNIHLENNKHSITSNKLIEVLDKNDFLHLIYINEVKYIGSTEPLEFAKHKIKPILRNIHRRNFISNFEEELYQTTLKKGRIKYYNH